LALPFMTAGRDADRGAALRAADFATGFRGADRDAGFFPEPALAFVFRFDAMTPSPPNSPDPAHAI